MNEVEAKKRYEKGFFNFSLQMGLLKFGLPFAIVITLFELNEPVSSIVKKFFRHSSPLVP